MNLNDVAVRIATPENYKDLKNIWRICFGDSDEYIDFFFNTKIKTCYPIVAVYNNTVIGGMYLMPIKTYEYGNIKKGIYGYAIGVLPEFRKRGVYKHIHSKIARYITENNMFYILSPANEKLCEYYKSLGFIENAYVSEKVFDGKSYSVRSFKVCELNLDKYEKLRNEFFADKNLLIWDKDALEYALSENKFTLGHNILISLNGKEYFLLIKKADNMLIVTESNIENPEEFNGFLMEHFSCDKIKWISPQLANSKKVLYGLTCNLKKDNYYLNLILN